MYNDPDMKSRSNIISFNDSSPNAILNISEVQCKDDGQYQCIVGYMNSHGIEIGTQTETSVYIQGKDVSYPKNFYVNTISAVDLLYF